ncbi:beta-galactosidase GalA [Paenibacillus guangzhouensis]|uniref:beta-galactosidase GalA n=1 Tax=Paenibacillus guangzhouensis TaxID=1473112 RepID=UPI001266AA06|nr:beta-galactosidase GalA [Paenibacillus guangzhouensis]
MDKEVTQPLRERLLMDAGWRFALGHATDIKRDFDFWAGKPFAKQAEGRGAIHPNFDDSDWREIRLPHDWAVELDFVHSSDNDIDYHGYKPIGRLHPATSIGWYRKRFMVSRSDEGKRLSIEFDGIFRDSMIWLNGYYLGRHESGYTSFRCDITDCVRFDGPNVLVVRADASHVEGWFYEGAGIYRHVWLVKTNPVHVAHWGTYVTSEVHDGFAEVTLQTTIANASDDATIGRIESAIYDADGRCVATVQSDSCLIGAWKEHEFIQRVRVDHPLLWDLHSPHLYRLVTIVKDGETNADEYATSFGIRNIHFDSDQGFFLNGRHVTIQGVCCHQDHAGVGTALPDRLQYYRIEKLKELGVNAYRTSHHPPTPELLEACDRLGMLVMDEHRQVGCSEETANQLRSLVKRDRNHPSIILWSIGNEEGGIQDTEAGARTARTMKRIVQALDPTRLVSYGGNNGGQRAGINGVVDVRGWNYWKIGANLDEYHRHHPKKPMIGSEEASTLCTRGMYQNDAEQGYVSAYDENFPDWGSGAEEWMNYYAKRPYLAGAFVWTGFDYRGEPLPYRWPCISSQFGLMDTCGFPKDNYYYYQAWWTEKTVLHLLPHWNWPGKEGQDIDVRCYSNCEEVELLLNGRRIGRTPMRQLGHVSWMVPYEPGILMAIGYRNGQEIATVSRETANAPVALRLVPDRSVIHADGEDVSCVAVEIVDDEGRVVPVADNEVVFSITGPGVFIGVGNGNPSSHEPDKFYDRDAVWKRKAFKGLCMAIVQSTQEPGELCITAESTGLAAAIVMIQTKACVLRSSI